jgi:putative intracellular protease/amidase
MKRFQQLSLALTMLLTTSGLMAQDPPKVLIFLQDGVEILDFAGPMEVFLQANFEVYTVGMTKDPIKAMGALTVTPDYSVEDYPDPDIISFYGGGGATTKSLEEPYKQAIQKMINQSEIQFSVCSGAFFLAEMGLLDGQTATTFHTLTDLLQDRYPKINVRKDVRFVDNGTVITTAGISAGIDGALHLVAKLRSPQVAESVAQNMEYDKWVPDEGLILPNPLIEKAKSEGLKEAILQHPDQAHFKGELLGLVEYFIQKEDPEQAIQVLDYTFDHYTPWFDDYQLLGTLYRQTDRPAPISEQDFMALVQNEQFEKAKLALQEAKRAFPDWRIYRGWPVHHLGYDLMGEGKTAKAIQVLELNTIGYPDHWNTWDSLAEAYLRDDQKDKAIQYYKKSLELNPNNENAKEMLQRIENGEFR